MKIYFCDICNESIPLADLESGAAITVKGKVICRTCNPASGSRPALASSGGGRAFAYALVAALVAIGVSIAYGRYREKEAYAHLAGLSGRISAAVSDRVQPLEGSLASLGERVAAAEKRASETGQGLEEGRRLAEKATAEVAGRLDEVREYIRENEDLKRRLERIEIKQTAVDEGLASLTGLVEGVRGEVRGLREAAAAVAAAAPAAAPASVPAALVREEALPASLQALVAKLKEPDPGVRWNAVTELGQSANPRVVPHLLPLLKDDDEFVRHNTALTLMELDAKPAVPALLDALGDSQGIVRDSAITALRRLTKQNFKFDPHASKDERERGIRAWRQWWQSNGEKFLNS